MTTARFRTIVVLYRPDEAAIANVARLADAGYGMIVIANAISPADGERLAARRDVALTRNTANLGLATALNQGIAQAVGEGADYVLLLDQDSRPAPTMAADLLAVADALAARGVRVGCVAPTLRDRKGAAPVCAGGDLVEDPAPATVITSGALLSAAALRAAGPMWEPLFIDGIDHEWCFRARAAGFAIDRTPRVVMEHDMGDAGITIGGRYRPIHRSPMRHYHIVRNILWLARLHHIPLAWRLKEVLKLGYRIPTYLAASVDRTASLRAIGRGLIDGVGAMP